MIPKSLKISYCTLCDSTKTVLKNKYRDKGSFINEVTALGEEGGGVHEFCDTTMAVLKGGIVRSQYLKYHSSHVGTMGWTTVI